MNKIKKVLLFAMSFVMATGLFAGCMGLTGTNSSSESTVSESSSESPAQSSTQSSLESSTQSSTESSVESSVESSTESSVESSTESSVEAQKYNFTVVTDKWALDGATTTEVEAGATLVFPADPTAEGKTFAGWVDIEGNAVAEGATMPEEDFAIFASWTVNAYTLTIKEEGKEDVTLKFGVEAVPETETEPEIIDVNSLDFVLSMLYADTDDAAYKFEKPEAWTLADTEITAYTVAKYSFTVITDRWAMDGTTTTRVAAGDTLTLPADPEVEGKTFTGWIDLEGNAVAEGATMPEEDFAIFATFTVDVYTLTIKEEGKEDVTLKFAVEAIYAEDPADAAIGIDALDYELSMLYVGDDDVAYKFEKPEAWTLEDTEITAYTVAKYSFTVVTDDGTTTTRLEAGATLVFPADPTAEGKTFAGWVDLEGNAVAEGATMPEEDFAVYASWTINVYTLTVNRLDDTVDTYKFGVESVDDIIEFNSLMGVVGFDDSTPTNACYEIVYSGIPEGGITLADTTISEVEQLKENAHQNFSYTDKGDGTHDKACADCGIPLGGTETCEIAWIDEITENGTKVKACVCCGGGYVGEIDVTNEKVFELNVATTPTFPVDDLVDENILDAYLGDDPETLFMSLYWGDVMLFDYYQADFGMDETAMDVSIFGDAVGEQKLTLGVEFLNEDNCTTDGVTHYIEITIILVR